jgi:hypothetical protein
VLSLVQPPASVEASQVPVGVSQPKPPGRSAPDVLAGQPDASVSPWKWMTFS